MRTPAILALLVACDPGAKPPPTQHIGFIRILGVDGNTALITTGGYAALPSPERHRARECCCESTDLYVRKHTGWRSSETTSSVCS